MGCIRAWSCSVPGDDYRDPGPAVAIVYASSRAKAHAAIVGYDEGGFDVDWTSIRVVRHPALDGMAGDVDGDVEHRGSVLRPMGWRYDGDELCAHCGLAEWDGEWPVCQECEACPDCRGGEPCATCTATDAATGGD
jgi:hypothetical protein